MNARRFFFHLRFLEEIWAKYYQKSAIMVSFLIPELLKIILLSVRSGICSHGVIKSSFVLFAIFWRNMSKIVQNNGDFCQFFSSRIFKGFCKFVF